MLKHHQIPNYCFPIEEVQIGRPLGIPLIVDTAAPLSCSLDYGAAIMHSLTKWIGGTVLYWWYYYRWQL